MTDRELMQQALEALENAVPEHEGVGWWRKHNKAKQALRDRLAQPEQWEQFYPDMGKPLDRMADNARELGLDYEPEQEPVAWNLRYNRYPREGDLLTDIHLLRWRETLPQSLNTTPRREWVGLTDDDLMELPGFDYDEAQFIAEQKFARAIEAKLREKNT